MSDDVLKAAVRRRTTIEELTVLGDELAEDHLRLAAGGVWRKLAFTWDCTYYAGDPCGDRVAAMVSVTH